MYEIAAERLTGVPAKQVNARQWGADREAEARAAYAFLTNAPVVEAGLIPHPTIANAHASPDALVGDDGQFRGEVPNQRDAFEDAARRRNPRGASAAVSLEHGVFGPRLVGLHVVRSALS